MKTKKNFANAHMQDFSKNIFEPFFLYSRAAKNEKIQKAPTKKGQVVVPNNISNVFSSSHFLQFLVSLFNLSCLRADFFVSNALFLIAKIFLWTFQMSSRVTLWDDLLRGSSHDQIAVVYESDTAVDVYITLT